MLSLTRREVLTVALGVFLKQALPKNIAQAQERKLDPFAFGGIWPDEQMVIASVVGKTTIAEIEAAKLHVDREELPNNFTRFIYPTVNSKRPNIIITDERGVVVFRRRMLLAQIPYLHASALNEAFGEPESLASPPYDTNIGYPAFNETRIWSSRGIAAFVKTSGDEAMEIHAFPKNPDPREYIKTWVEGDFVPDAPKHPLGLVLIDGLLSNSNNKTFEHFKDVLFPYYQKVARLSYAGSDKTEYGGTDTLQSIYKSAEILKDMIDKLKDYHPLDVLAYSLGGAVFNAYAAMYVLPVNGPHREGVIRKIATLHSPLHGVPHYLLSGTPADSIQELLAMAENPEITIPINIAMAKVLRDKRNIGILNLGNESDCIVPPGFSVNLGFGKNIDLGRGIGGAQNCSDIVNALLPLTKIPDNAGHTQLLSDYGTIKIVEKFLKSGQLTPVLG